MDTRILALTLELPINTALLQIDPQDWQGCNVNLDEFTIDVAGMWEAEDKAKAEDKQPQVAEDNRKVDLLDIFIDLTKLPLSSAMDIHYRDKEGNPIEPT